MNASHFRPVLCGALAATVLAVLLPGAGAAAETKIIEPTATPYHVHLDATGKPIAFTVVASKKSGTWLVAAGRQGAAFP